MSTAKTAATRESAGPHDHGLQVVAAALLLGGFAFGWTMIVGVRGHFAVDQSVMFDAAYRMTEGQVPYRDFLSPNAFLTISYVWLLFEFFGVSYSVYVLAGAVLNVLGTLLAMLTVWHVVPRPFWPTILAGAITSFWYQAPFGTPWPEQTAFIFAFLGLNLVLATRPLDGRLREWRMTCLFLAGVSLGISFLGKQNAAALFLGVYFLHVVLVEQRGLAHKLHCMAAIALGLIGAGATFAIWLHLYSDPAQFVYATIEIPSGALLPRLAVRFPGVLSWPFVGQGDFAVMLVFYSAELVSIAFLWLHRSWRHSEERPQRTLFLLSLTSLSLIVFQNLFSMVTLNDASNCYPFAGVLLGFQCALLPVLFTALPPALFESHDRVPRWASSWKVLLGAMVAVLIARGVYVGYTRTVHDVFSDSTFEQSLGIPGFEALLWGSPTPLSGFDYRAEHLMAVADHLKRADENFFVYPDFTVLYAMVGRPSRQPLLFFWRGISYPHDYSEELDLRIVGSLIRSKVRFFVFEEPYFGPGYRQLGDLPRLEHFLVKNFRESVRFGPFVVHARVRSPAPRQFAPRSTIN